MLSVEKTEGAGKSPINSSNSTDVPNLPSQILNWPNVKLQVLEGQETLARSVALPTMKK
jgi:hypothetical protein